MPDTRGGVVLQVDPVAPDAEVPRQYPCQALRELDERLCGATPSRLYRRVCAHFHLRDVWLCTVHHATLSGPVGLGVCHQCANDRTHPHRCAIELIDVEAVRAQ